MRTLFESLLVRRYGLSHRDLRKYYSRESAAGILGMDPQALFREACRSNQLYALEANGVLYFHPDGIHKASSAKFRGLIRKALKV